jgi:hypothetical protein
MVKENETVELLRTIQGVGLVNATTIAAYTAYMELFKGNFKKCAVYKRMLESFQE